MASQKKRDPALFTQLRNGRIFVKASAMAQKQPWPRCFACKTRQNRKKIKIKKEMGKQQQQQQQNRQKKISFRLVLPKPHVG